jgi:transcription initiation factor IIE alpha subunit
LFFDGLTDEELKAIKHWIKNTTEERKAIEIATNLLDVLDDETIAIKTGLNIEEIRKLRNEQ